MLNVLIGISGMCTKHPNDWNSYWSGEVAKVKFIEDDLVSDFYSLSHPLSGKKISS